MPRRSRNYRFAVASLAFAVLSLVSSGCAVVALGAAGAAGGATYYAYSKGNVTRTYMANVEDVRAATRTALGELKLPVVKEELATNGGSIESRSSNSDHISITLEAEPGPVPSAGPVTIVGVRVATFGDEALSQMILDQIGAHLTSPTAVRGPVAPPPPVVPAAATVQSPPPPLAK
jgi:Protein of unknown function (DUF3568)